MTPLVEYLKDMPYEGEQINRHIFDNEWRQMYEDYMGESPEYQKVYDFVYENLRTHDTEKLCKAICKKYEHIDFGKIEVKDAPKYTLYCFGNDDELDELAEDDNLLCFFNYFYTRDLIDKGIRYVLLEPLYPEDASDSVEKAHNKLYHFSHKKDTDNILRTGLRCKSKNLSEGDYRSFPARIYCLAIPHKFKSDKFNEAINQFIKETSFKSESYDLLEINLNKQSSSNWRQKFYQDGYMMTEYAIFTYHNIPAKFIRKVDYGL